MHIAEELGALMISMRTMLGHLVRRSNRKIASIPGLKPKFCVACGHSVGRFLAYRGGCAAQPPLMRALGMVGSDIDNFECPRCGAHDRERHLQLYLAASELWSRMAGMRILHIAPERHLSQRILALSPVAYVRCDLHPETEEVKRVDIEAMPFADASQDLVIANHVLEHVEDDRRALQEIRRVLVPGGSAILQTPYSSILQKTWSDLGIRSNEARLQAYGQEDHVRLFGKDIFARFAAGGLKPAVQTHAELLAEHDPEFFGVNAAEPFFLFQREH